MKILNTTIVAFATLGAVTHDYAMELEKTGDIVIENQTPHHLQVAFIRKNSKHRFVGSLEDPFIDGSFGSQSINVLPYDELGISHVRDSDQFKFTLVGEKPLFKEASEILNLPHKPYHAISMVLTLKKAPAPSMYQRFTSYLPFGTAKEEAPSALQLKQSAEQKTFQEHKEAYRERSLEGILTSEPTVTKLPGFEDAVQRESAIVEYGPAEIELKEPEPTTRLMPEFEAAYSREEDLEIKINLLKENKKWIPVLELVTDDSRSISDDFSEICEALKVPCLPYNATLNEQKRYALLIVDAQSIEEAKKKLRNLQLAFHPNKWERAKKFYRNAFDKADKVATFINSSLNVVK